MRIIKKISHFNLYVGGIFLLIMMLHVTADVVMKYIWNAPIPGTLEIVSAYYMVGGVFFPLAVVEIYRGSIGVDVAYQFMPRPAQIFCMAVVLIGCAAVYLTLAWTGWGDAMQSFRISEVMMGTVLVSVWPSRFIQPIGFLFAGIVCVLYLYGMFTSPGLREQLIALHPIEEDV